MKPITYLSLIIFSAAIAISANASVISIDFNAGGTGTQTGLAGAPDAAGAGAFWNGANGGSPTLTGLTDSTGVATNVDFTIDSRGAFTGPVDQELSSGHSALFNEYLSSRADDNNEDLRTGSFTNLIAGNAYDLYFYGQGDNFTDTNFNGGQNVGVRIGSDVRHTSHDGVSGGDGNLVEDVEFVVFRGIVADATGTINFEHFNPGQGLHGTDSSFFDSSTGLADADNNPSRFSAINGVQIVGDFIIPEPTSMALVGLLGLFAAFVRRRRVVES